MTTEAVDVGPSSSFIEGKGQQLDVNERPICIFRHNDILYALDHHCYHMGGPLANGDIEDLTLGVQVGKRTNSSNSNNVESYPCVVCPWHKYKISLETGEGLYIQTDPFVPEPKPKVIKSRGKKQRTHQVYEQNGRVMVILNTSEKIKYESDFYASEDFQLRMRRRN